MFDLDGLTPALPFSRTGLDDYGPMPHARKDERRRIAPSLSLSQAKFWKFRKTRAANLVAFFERTNATWHEWKVNHGQAAAALQRVCTLRGFAHKLGLENWSEMLDEEKSNRQGTAC